MKVDEEEEESEDGIERSILPDLLTRRQLKDDDHGREGTRPGTKGGR
jgi:hypothetical protein